MPGFPALLHGQYPRSPDLVQATRDLDRDRTTLEQVEEVREQDARTLASVQEEAGVTGRAPGLFRWQDIARPLVEAARGLEVGPLTRFFETNTFYRAPRVTGDPSLPDPLGADVQPVPEGDGEAVATLPGPWTFSRWAVNADDPDALARTLAGDVLAPEARDLAARGFDRVVLHEPWLGVHGLEEAEADALSAALRDLDEAVDLPLAAHVYMGPATGEGLPRQGPGDRGADPADAVDAVLASGVDGIGVDFLQTTLDAVTEHDLGDRTLVAGVVDAQNSQVEDPDTLSDFLTEAQERTGAHEVRATHTASLEFLPSSIAEEKVHALGEVEP